MPNKIILAPAWCEDHLAQCYYSHDENTGITKHLGNIDSIFPAQSQELAAEMNRLEGIGYKPAHRGGGEYTLTRYNDRLANLPLDWQMAAEERASVDEYQDW